MPVITSHGDYASDSEKSLENYIGGPLYAHQSALPTLPVPPLAKTLSTLNKSAKSLAANDREYAAFFAALKSFTETKSAQQLHSRLLSLQETSSNSRTSWLQKWWNTLGYLHVRDPIPINVSYFFQFKDDPSAPDCVTRGAAALIATAIFRNQTCSGELPCEEIGRKNKTKLCSTAYKYMFNACRIPGKKSDTYNIYDPSRNHHVVVVRKGLFFVFDFVDPVTNTLKPINTIESLLNRCKNIADSNITPPNFSHRIGILTSNNRTQWAEDRERLIRENPQAARALQAIESGAILLCLDDNSPVSHKCTSEVFWHGGKDNKNNRFFDKSIQIFCSENGKCGLLGEHSMMDGMPMVRFADYLTEVTYDKAKELSPCDDKSHQLNQNHNFRVVRFGGVDAGSAFEHNLAAMIQSATLSYDSLVDSQELTVEFFRQYGANFIKKRAKMSPDAFVQMAIQLATYRLFGCNVGTYEASQVRKFLHGRTETTRSCSLESAKWVKSMGLREDPRKNANGDSRQARKALLEEAAATHVEYLKAAGEGMGIDRHLFGLRMLVGASEEIPALFDDHLFNKAKKWRVSTSHLTHKNFSNWGWGEVVPDGVGIAYSIHGDHCVFNVTAMKREGFSLKLCHLLAEAMAEMRTLFDDVMSKL